jgi:hypothetical protein
VPAAVKLPSGAVRFVPEKLDAWLAECEMGAAEREVSAARANRARQEAYDSPPLNFPLSAARPQEAVERTNEEEDHAR